MTVLGLLLQLLSVACFVFVLLHAFQRSVGAGFMVLLIPFFNVYYGFAQFEHPKKGLILAGWLGLFVVGTVLRVLALQTGA
ncbi:MAG: hypothetical protein ACOZIN_05480 [Myxococcota bacterium]